MKNFRIVVLALSAAILVVPQAVLAGGGSFGGGKSGPSGGNGSFGMGKGVGSRPVVSRPVSSLNPSGTATINSSSGKVIAPTIHKNANNSVVTGGNSMPKSKQVMDESSIGGFFGDAFNSLSGGPLAEDIHKAPEI